MYLNKSFMPSKKKVINSPFQKQPPSWRALTGGGSFFGFFRSFFVGWVQKNFWVGFGILLMFRLNFLAVCLFPAKIWGCQKNFERKIAIFGYFWQILGLIKNFGMWVTKKFSKMNNSALWGKIYFRDCLYDVCGQFDMRYQ